MNNLSQRQFSETVSQSETSAFAPLTPVFTVGQFSERHPAFSEPALRNLIFNAEPRESTRGTIPGNGLLEAGAILRIGRKVLIHEPRFFNWLESRTRQNGATA